MWSQSRRFRRAAVIEHRAVALIATLAIFASSAAGAARWPGGDDHALPCRPTIACTADLVPPGSVEVELGYLFRRLGAGALQHSTPVLVKLTLARWVQLQVDTNGYTYASGAVPARFVDDVVIGAKLHLVNQRDLFPSLSWSAALSVPIGAQPGYVRTYDSFLTAYVTKDVRRLHLDLNLGVNLWRLDGPVLIQPWIALAASIELPRRFTAMLELYYFTDAAPIAPRDGGTLIAAAYAARSWLVVDLGFDVGWIQEQRAVSAFTGLTIIPGILW
ncbi:MAG TPA: hypothetical protein VFF06_26335 [Polyangia bacterium]|nr:hypothetical protein [Polyangia bacterium]